MSDKNANITIPIDLNNPGQFFACCGLLELADDLPVEPIRLQWKYEKPVIHLD